MFLGIFLAALLGVAAVYIGRAADHRQKRQRQRGVAAAFLSSLIALFALEIPAFLGWVDYRIILSPDGASSLYNPHYTIDRELIGIHPPHERFQGSVAGDLVHRLQIDTDRRYEVDVRWDRNGFRNAEEVLTADIVLIGDSFLEAVLVPWEETVASRLSRALQRPVLNLGHGGYGPQQELAALRRFGFAAEPKVVIWFFYEGNDLSNYETYEAIQSDWDRWLAREHGFLRRSLLVNVALATGEIGRRKPRNASFAESRQGILESPGAHQGATMYFGYRCAPLNPAEQHSLAGTEKVLATAARECREHNAKFLVVFVPTKWRVYHSLVRVDPTSELAQWRASDLNQHLVSGIPGPSPMNFVDLTRALKAAASRGELVYFLDDAHWTGQGHQVASEILQGRITESFSPSAVSDTDGGN